MSKFNVGDIAFIKPGTNSPEYGVILADHSPVLIMEVKDTKITVYYNKVYILNESNLLTLDEERRESKYPVYILFYQKEILGIFNEIDKANKYVEKNYIEPFRTEIKLYFVQ